MTRGGTALALTLLLLARPGVGGAEPEEVATPTVTLDALPLGIPAADLPEAARVRAEAVLGGSLSKQWSARCDASSTPWPG